MQVLKSAAPHFIAMNPLSAILFILCGAALVRASEKRAKRPDKVVLACAAVILLGGAMKVAECAFGFDLSFDQLFFRKELNSPGPFGPSEIAMNTAISFICCGMALLLLDVDTPRGFRPSQVFSVIVGLIALLALIGYGYRVLPLYTFGSRLPMALNSAIGFGLFSLAALGVRPRRGLMMVITSDSTGGAMARRLLPAAILIPLILGALRFSSEKHGFFEIESGISLFAFANIVLFTAVIWWNAKLLFRAEQERSEAMEKLKQTSLDLERSNTELQQFAYVASHDLTEPLRMITSYLELLSSRAKEKLGSEEREFIGYAVDGARRMQTLIQDLLAYARVDTRGRPLEATDCEKVLATVLANLKVAIEESHAVIEHDRLPVVEGDAVQLTQVFQNLIGNAIKFRGGKTPQIYISARRDEIEWLCQVKDNGIGTTRKTSAGFSFCSSGCTRGRNIRALAWGWRFAKKSLSVTVGGSGRNPSRARGRRFSLPSRQKMRISPEAKLLAMAESTHCRRTRGR